MLFQLHTFVCIVVYVVRPTYEYISGWVIWFLNNGARSVMSDLVMSTFRECGDGGGYHISTLHIRVVWGKVVPTTLLTYY